VVLDLGSVKAKTLDPSTNPFFRVISIKQITHLAREVERCTIMLEPHSCGNIQWGNPPVNRKCYFRELSVLGPADMFFYYVGSY
jgi:hypothetical protein